MKILIVLLLAICFIGCEKEEITLYDAYLKNTTNHQIEIKPYANGVAISSQTIQLVPNASFQIADGFDRGIVENGGFSSNYFGNIDSFQVIFDEGAFQIFALIKRYWRSWF